MRRMSFSSDGGLATKECRLDTEIRTARTSGNMPPHPNFPCHGCGQQFGTNAIMWMIRGGPRSATTAVCSECTSEPKCEVAAGNCTVGCCGRVKTHPNPTELPVRYLRCWIF